ncbi:MAG: hypothetical protein HQ582_05035 [Planctomycetes bacterium]|nr:hypothetical protein [Planctomycetota bacterium]
MAPTSTTKTASKSKSKAKVPVIDTRNLDLGSYKGRCDARKQLFVAACLQGDFKAAASVLAEAGKDSMRQHRYGKGAGAVPRVTLVFEGVARERQLQTQRWLREAEDMPTAPGLAPMSLDAPTYEHERDERDDEFAHHSERERGDMNGHAPPTTDRPPADDSTLTPSSPGSGPLGGVFGEKNLEKISGGPPPVSC